MGQRRMGLRAGAAISGDSASATGDRIELMSRALDMFGDQALLPRNPKCDARNPKQTFSNKTMRKQRLCGVWVEISCFVFRILGKAATQGILAGDPDSQ
jgi:hypothetical protein